MKIFKFDRYKFVAYISIAFIFVLGGLTAIIGAKEIGFGVLSNYRNRLPKNPTVADQLKGMILETENEFNLNFKYKNWFIDYYGMVQRAMNKRIINDVDPSLTVIKTSNNQLVFAYPQKIDVDKYVKNITDLSKYLNSMQIPLLYIQAPYKIIDKYTMLPPTIEDCRNENADVYLKGLENNNIDYIDLRKEIINDDINKDNVFYKTDHHWTTETAFWAFKKVVNRLNSNYSFNIDNLYTDINNYNKKVYENFFLGSQGKRVGSYYIGNDNFTLITPKFDTQIKMTIYEQNKPEESIGSFNDVVLKRELIDTTKSVNTNRYAVYSGGDYPELRFENKNVNTGRVLIIKDSFALPFCSFLSTSINEIRVLDLRLYKNGTVNDYVKEYKPDIVLILYSPSSFREGMFDFNRISRATYN